MHHRLLALLCASGLSCTAHATEVSTEDVKANAEALKRAILVGPAFESLRELTDRFGPRLTSSAAYTQSAEWTADKFRSYEVDKVYFDTFTVPNGWQRGAARGMILSERELQLHIESVGWSPATPAAGVRGEVLWLSDISEQNLQAQAARIRNRIVMLDTDRIFANGTYPAVRGAQNAYAMLARLGARAVLMPKNASGNLLG